MSDSDGDAFMAAPAGDGDGDGGVMPVPPVAVGLLDLPPPLLSAVLGALGWRDVAAAAGACKALAALARPLQRRAAW